MQCERLCGIMHVIGPQHVPGTDEFYTLHCNLHAYVDRDESFHITHTLILSTA